MTLNAVAAGPFVCRREWLASGRSLTISSQAGASYGVTTPGSSGTTLETVDGSWTLQSMSTSAWPRSIVDSAGGEVGRIERTGRNHRSIALGGQDYDLRFGGFSGRWKIAGLLTAHRTLGSRLTTGTNAKPFVGAITADFLSQPNPNLLLLVACYAIMSRVDAMGSAQRSSDSYRQSLGQ
jgi:hypothetical protein